MRRHLVYGSTVAALALVFAGLLAHERLQRPVRARVDADNARIVAVLGLTDLALWTEARYTRHPSQADFFSPFQDLACGMEHFPAGSLIAPPAHLAAGGGARRAP
jgi:hypothetical protein